MAMSLRLKGHLAVVRKGAVVQILWLGGAMGLISRKKRRQGLSLPVKRGGNSCI
jgi:hypothetical protein